MPELPEVETARLAIERAGLGRPIAAVDDTDTWVCRPHAPGDLAAALIGRQFTGAFRRGKSLWCETSTPGRRSSAADGPVLGLHLGMSGRIFITGPAGAAADHLSADGGDWLGGRYGQGAEDARRNPVWDRFTVTFTDGGVLRLFDKRRLGRVRLDPDIDALGPDAQAITLAQLTDRLARSSAPIKARLLDQSVIAGVGNLLADQTLWQARLDPRRPSRDLTVEEVAGLRRVLRQATREAIRHGGVHTGSLIPHRGPGRHCPRCGAELQRATVGGRTTWFCPDEQV